MVNHKRRVAPRELSESSKELWREIVYGWELEEYHERTLTQALLSLDRAEQARQILDSDGLTVVDRFGQIKEHPLVSVERLNRLAYARLIRELGLDLADLSTRPPRVGGGDRW
jgi:phage terminase small subunit